MITIRHKTGPLAGTEQDITPTGDRVAFGRDAEKNHVVYPSDEVRVSREHFALVRKPGGHWTYELSSGLYVAADRCVVGTGQRVRGGETVVLGRPGGPSFEIVLSGADSPPGDSLPDTKVWQPHARRRVVAMIGASAAVVAAGAFLAWPPPLSESFSAELRQKLVQAAYFVVVETPRGYSFGSASPVAPDLLATNAHVAEMFLRMGEKGRMFVRSPGANGREYEVVEVMIHPGYAELKKFLRQNFFLVGGKPLTGASIESYDVALLRVAPGANLGPILEIATRAELEKIEPGYPVMRAGYPSENVIGAEVNALLAATPNLAQGMISGLTDMFRLPTNPKHRRLIHHSVPNDGGASGSPLVGPNGRIVALNNAGSYIFVSKNVVPAGRISSSAQVNYAQRADWLLELLEKKADAALEQDRKYWTTQTAQFKRASAAGAP